MELNKLKQATKGKIIKKVKQEPKEKGFTEWVAEVSAELAKRPMALAIQRKRVNVEGDEGVTAKFMFVFDDNTVTAKGVRRKVGKMVNEMYQSGAYNYQKIAEGLRVDVNAVRALLDFDFRTQNNIK